ncbi:hypothetical protein PV08_11054 [Exophiala spinifera]|uniref:Xylanolytic transcriptional activator regulatory domain-containing protein n=1 Tax=Exophiala spinifera TaxID=91928 RepID=A0A0D2BFH9_9EURO|nr:uncharacterized protein PV08_11054 [Exophiala spinifera]KIW10094.1 hypothetical protein PV08_11054 [Exophiala spinifera]
MADSTANAVPRKEFTFREERRGSVMEESPSESYTCGNQEPPGSYLCNNPQVVAATSDSIGSYPDVETDIRIPTENFPSSRAGEMPSAIDLGLLDNTKQTTSPGIFSTWPFPSNPRLNSEVLHQLTDVAPSEGCAGYADFLKDLASHPQSKQASPSALPHNPFESHDIWEIFMNSTQGSDIDFEYDGLSDLAALETHATMGLSRPQSHEQQEHQAFLIGVNAFSTSLWNWTPSAEDTGVASERHLAVGDSDQEKLRNVHVPELCKKLASSSNRDRILALFITVCERKNIPKLIKSFSSPTLMECLIPLALHHLSTRPLSFIHPPSSVSCQISPEMLAIMMAHGASLTSVRAIQRLGYAIAELLRKAIVQRWEENNSETRDLDCLRAFTLTNMLFLWSGNRRKMEIAESFTQPVVTMLRRSGMLRRDYYVEIRPSETQTGPELDDLWKRWVEQETKIRLVHQLFIHDCQVSMTYFTNPLMSCSEMQLPMPQPVEIWLASSAQEWKSHLLARSGPTIHEKSLSQLIKEVSNQDTRPPDQNLGEWCYLVLYGVWHVGRSLQELQNTLQNDEDFECMPGPFMLYDNSRFERLVANILIPEDAVGRSSHELSFIQSYLIMALCVPLEAIQAFAGKHGEAEAARVFPRLQNWSVTRNARLGIWRAAQTLRKAENLGSIALRDFHAVATYHAGVALYVYGVLTATRQRRSGQELARGQQSSYQHICLGPKYSSDVKNFINFGQGLPVIEGVADEFGQRPTHSVLVPGSILEYTCQILKSPCQIGEGNLAPLVDKMAQLLRELARAASIAGFA